MSTKAWRLLFKLLMASVLVLGTAFIAWGIELSRNADQRTLERVVRHVMIALQPAIEYALVSGEVDYLRDLQGKLQDMDGIHEISIVDDHGLTIFRMQTGHPAGGRLESVERSLQIAGKSARISLLLDPSALHPDRRASGIALASAGMAMIGLSIVALVSIRRWHAAALEKLAALVRSSRLAPTIHDFPPGMERELAREIMALHERATRMELELEEHQEQMSAELYSRIEELIAKNEELERKREAAETSNREKSAFLANISHELRTPLNAIIGLTEHLKPNEISKHEIELIGNSARHLLALIDQILLANRSLAADLDIDSHSTANLFSEILEVVDQMAFENNLWLVYDQDPGIVGIMTDRMRFKQIILNLLTNALKYTLKGGVTLKVIRNDTKIDIQICDTGPGIPDEDLIRLMQPFSRRSNDPREGFGLGLYITQSLCDSLGYELEYSRNPGGGSIFHVLVPREHVIIGDATLVFPWDEGRIVYCDTRYRIFHLPAEIEVRPVDPGGEFQAGSVILLEHPDSLHHGVVEKASEAGDLVLFTPFLREAIHRQSVSICRHITTLFSTDAPEKIETEPDEPQMPSPPPGQRHIWSGLVALIADDNPTNLEVLKIHLQDSGMKLIDAGDAHEVLSNITKEGPDIALLDGHMPGMSANEVGEQIRSLSPLTQIIFVSADLFLMQNVAPENHDAFLGKPIRQKDLFDVFQKCFRPSFEPSMISNITTYHRKTVQRIFSLSLKDLKHAAHVLSHPERLDGEGFFDIVHRLNGTGKYCGGTRLVELCTMIEDIHHESGNLQPSAIGTSCLILRREIMRLVSDIRREIEQLDQLGASPD